MAYPAVKSLIQTLELFKRTYPALIHGQTAVIVGSLLSTAEYFQRILEKTSLQKHEFVKIKELEGEMKAVVQQAEDLIEPNIVEVMRTRYSQQEKNNMQDEERVLLQDLPQLIDKIGAVRKDLEAFIGHGHGHATSTTRGTTEEHFFKRGVSSFPNHGSTALLQDAIVGLDVALVEITDRLLGSASEREAISILGMGGCGKTTLARKAQSDPSIKSRFDIQVWVTISQEDHVREVLLSLVGCITGYKFLDMSDDQLMEKSYKELKGRRYLIVIDDIWSTKIWDLIARALPDDNNGSRIILTTRLKDVAEYVNPDTPPLEIKQLSSYESMNLLCYNLFGTKNTCPSELEEIGKKIVGKCQGLPLAILVVAGHLSKVPMTKESWDAVAKNVSKVVASYPDKCQAVLAMSYHHLPIHLKPCFLHIGLFPEDYDIKIRRLIQLWVAERFLKWDRLKSPEEVVEDCLEDLISRNLIIVGRRKSDGKMKSCGIHDLLRDLSVSEAQKEMFLDVIKINQSLKISATNHESPRLSWHTPISSEFFSKSSQVMLRSLYLFKEPSRPPIYETLQLKALRVLSVFSHSYSLSYPRKTFDLAMLRYLEIMPGKHFPETLAFMCNLETFIFFHSEVVLRNDETLSL